MLLVLNSGYSGQSLNFPSRWRGIWDLTFTVGVDLSEWILLGLESAIYDNDDYWFSAELALSTYATSITSPYG